jgi:hypothetical protein
MSDYGVIGGQGVDENVCEKRIYKHKMKSSTRNEQLATSVNTSKLTPFLMLTLHIMFYDDTITRRNNPWLA